MRKALALRWRAPALAVLLGAFSLAATACGGAASTAKAATQSAGQPATSGSPTITAVGAENEYAQVISEIGGQYVSVAALMNNPSVDPHTYESSTKDASLVAHASLVVQNGLGYDSFMNRIEKASPNSARIVITAATVLGDGPSTQNPHLWYKPGNMAKVAAQIEASLSNLQPSHKAYFAKQLAAFNASLKTWQDAIDQVKAADAGTPVAVTEPVADYLLSALGFNNLTPWAFQAAVMNGTDPSPQAASQEEAALSGKKAAVFVYNTQASDAVAKRMLTLAQKSGVPVVGVTETMPQNSTYVAWMTSETKALGAAAAKASAKAATP